MEQQEQFTCDACHEREATHHTVMYCGGDRAEERHLCLQCFQALASPEQLAEERRTSEIVAHGKCKYCGAPAAGGSSTMSESGFEEWEFWCEPCRIDLVQFNSLAANAITDIDIEDEGQLDSLSQQLADRQRRQAEFMRERVRQRSQ